MALGHCAGRLLLFLAQFFCLQHVHSQPVPNYGSGADGVHIIAKETLFQDTCFYLTRGVLTNSAKFQLSSCFGITVGTELLLHQTQSQTSAGNFAFVFVAAVNSSCHVTTTTALPKAFSSGTVGGTAPSMTQVVIVRQYTNVSIAGIKTSSSWDGFCGGIFFNAHTYNMLC